AVSCCYSTAAPGSIRAVFDALRSAEHGSGDSGQGARVYDLAGARDAAPGTSRRRARGSSARGNPARDDRSIGYSGNCKSSGMRRPGRNLAFSLMVCCFSTQAAVLVTLKNGSQVEAASESREGNTEILTIGRLPDPPAPESSQTAAPQEPDAGELLANASAAQAIDAVFIASVAKVE